MLGRRRVLELVEDMPQFGNFRIGRNQGGEARRHRLERGPHLDHLDHFALRLANDVDSAARNRANETLLFQDRERLPDRCPAHAECSRQLALVKTEFLLRIVNVGVGNRALAWSRKLVEFKGPSARVAGEPERSANAERSTRVAIVFIGPRRPG